MDSCSLASAESTYYCTTAWTSDSCSLSPSFDIRSCGVVIDDVDENVNEHIDVVIPRGWSMRRGHLKQLQKPKRGKAAMWAEIQGQGKEVSRGRSVFKRSVNRGQISFFDRAVKESTAKRRHALRQDMVADSICYEEDLYWDWQEWQCWEQGDSVDEGEWSPSSDLYFLSEKEQTKQAPMGAFDNLCTRLSTIDVRFDSKLFDAETLKRPLQPLERLQRKFLTLFGLRFCKELRKLMGSIHLKPATISSEVLDRFLAAEKTTGGTLRAAYHGTASRFLPSIYDKGLLIPGQGNELRVRNGSMHGLGIYTASLDGASLSWGFCSAPTPREKKIIVCGVLDDAAAGNTYTMGRLTVTRESDHIRHVGNAMVIFDHRRIAPLFEASLRSLTTQRPSTVKFDFARRDALLVRMQNEFPEKSPRSHHNRRARRRFLMRRVYGDRRPNAPEAFLSRRGARKRRSKGL